MQPTIEIKDGDRPGEILIRCFCGEYGVKHDRELVAAIQRRCPGIEGTTFFVSHKDDKSGRVNVFHIKADGKIVVKERGNKDGVAG
jgi:hypothetical protein